MSEAMVPAAAEPVVVADGEARPRPAGADRRRGAGCRPRGFWSSSRGGLRTQEPRRRTGGRWGSSWGGARPEASAWVR